MSRPTGPSCLYFLVATSSWPVPTTVSALYWFPPGAIISAGGAFPVKRGLR